MNKSNLPRHHKSWKCTQTRITNKNETNDQADQKQEQEQEQNNDLTEEYKSE